MSIEERIVQIERSLQEIKERNTRVAADKAWETSWFRVLCIVVVTYIIASIVMYAIGVTNYFTSALIPTIGYFLSTRSLPLIKQWWIKNYYKN